MRRSQSASGPVLAFPIVALLVLACYATPAFLGRDLPASFAVFWIMRPWHWDWPAILLLAAHAAAFLIVIAGAGAAPLWLLGRGMAGTADRVLFRCGAGAGVLGTTVLGLGLCGLATRPAILAVYAALGLAGFLATRRAALTVERAAKAGRRIGPVRGRGWAPIALAVTWVAVLGAADLLAPENFPDALVYHLAAPRQWLMNGRITSLDPFATHFPLLMSMHYLVGLAVAGERLARVVNVLAAVGIVAAAAALARGWLDAAATRWGTALALTSPILVLIALHAGADCGVAFFTLLALLAVVRAVPRWPARPVRRSWLVRAGVAAGLAAAAKPQGLAVPVLLVLFVAGAGREVRRGWLVLVLPAAAGWAPWGVKSWLLTGNPLFPFLDGVFPSPIWTDFSRHAYVEELVSKRNLFTAADVGILGNAGGFVSRFKLGLVGPVPMLAAVALILGPWPVAMRLPALFAAALAAGWAVTVPVWRFMAAGLALFPFLLVRRDETRARRVIMAVALALQLAWIPLVLDVNDRPWGAARKGVAPTAYYADIHMNSDLDAVEMLEKFGGTAPRKRTVAVGDVYGFLLPRWAITAGWFEPSPFLRWAAESRGPERLRVRLKQRGVRYILVNPGEVIRLVVWMPLIWDGPKPYRIMRAFFTRHTALAYARANGWIYAVLDRAPGAQLPECLDGGLDKGYRVATICVEEARAALMAGDNARAIRFGWAGVAAAPHSGMAWAMLGDCMYGAEKWDEATNVYRTAGAFGWTTSVLYRNCALAYGKVNQWSQARQAMGYALALDPASRRVQEDIYAIHDRLDSSIRRAGERARAAAAGRGP